MNEQRQHPRYAIELDAEANFDGQRFMGRTHDISRGGFCFHMPDALPLGAVGTVKLALVFSENSFSEQLELPATIVWCTPIGGAYQVGFKFGPLSPAMQGYLTLFIQFLEGDDEDDDEDGDDEENADEGADHD
jgi:c-di-GMP-binding flagellar brake protein YcgR